MKHHGEVAEASCHDEEMEYFVVAEVRVFSVEVLHLHGVYDSADGVDDPAGDKQDDCGSGHASDQVRHREGRHPAHGNVDGCGDPLWKVTDKGGTQNTGQGKGPDKSQEPVAVRLVERDHADRRIASCDQKIDACVIKALQMQAGPGCSADCMEQGAGKVKSCHAPDKDNEGSLAVRGVAAGRYQRRRRRQCQNESCHMCDRASGFFQMSSLHDRYLLSVLISGLHICMIGSCYSHVKFLINR